MGFHLMAIREMIIRNLCKINNLNFIEVVSSGK